MQKALIFSALILFSLSGNSQEPSKLSTLRFINTKFMTDFIEMREIHERTVRRVKKIQFNYADADMEAVISTHNASADKFNTVLERVKADFCNKEKQRFIKLFPEDYVLILEHELEKAKEFHSLTFTKTIVDLMGTEHVPLLKLGVAPRMREDYEYFRHIKKCRLAKNSSVFKKEIIDVYKFRQWDEID